MELAYRIFNRWRQGNFFRYMRHHFAIRLHPLANPYSYPQDMEEEAKRIPIGFYNNDSSEGENSPVARVVVGLWFYKTPFARFCAWAYMAAMGKDPFDDFDSGGELGGRWRDYLCVYPTEEGPMPTQHWEAMRVGVDEVGYLHTLEQAAARAKASVSADGKLRAEIARAELLVSEILSEIDARDATETAEKLTPKSLQEMRRKRAQHISRLQGVPGSPFRRQHSWLPQRGAASADCLVRGEEPRARLEDSYWSLLVAEAVWKSAQTEQPVAIEDCDRRT